MPAIISAVSPDSLAEELGLKAGDRLISINGNKIKDVIDYMYYEAATELMMLVEIDGEEVLFEIEKDSEEPIGIDFEDYLMDRQRSCKNKCIFCFIDQLPKGLRKTLYFKDDDARLSFLMGNYITLTNLTEEDIDRIIKMRISPINISVHTTDPELRVKMMANPNARRINEILRCFADARIEMNCQIVLCKGINDGAHLEKSLRDLAALAPYVKSTSVVPVGISNHRDGLYPLVPFQKQDARNVIELIDRIGEEQVKHHGRRGCYASDEFYILADYEIPDEDYYDCYPQIENGVGIITGVLAADYMDTLLQKAKAKYPGLEYKIYAIVNHFFGKKITVSGLVTGTDILEQLKDQALPDRLLIPSSMLRSERDLFLDSLSLEEVEQKLQRPIGITMNDGMDLLDKILGR